MKHLLNVNVTFRYSIQHCGTIQGSESIWATVASDILSSRLCKAEVVNLYLQVVIQYVGSTSMVTKHSCIWCTLQYVLLESI